MSCIRRHRQNKKKSFSSYDKTDESIAYKRRGKNYGNNNDGDEKKKKKKKKKMKKKKKKKKRKRKNKK